MNAIPKDQGRATIDSGGAVAIDAGGAAHKGRGGGAQEVHNLMADVQDLLVQMAHVADPEIARLRARVAETLTAAKRAVTDGTERVQRQTRDAMTAGDGYVRNQPWQAVGFAAAAGIVMGFLLGRR